MKWEEEKKDDNRFNLDRSWLRNSFLTRERARIVQYPNEDTTMVFYTKLYKIHNMSEESFSPKYPILSKFFKTLGIKDIIYGEKMNQEDFSNKFKIKL